VRDFFFRRSVHIRIDLSNKATARGLGAVKLEIEKAGSSYVEPQDYDIDRIHSRAITDEIGERLRMAHSLVSPELPPRIQRQLDQLRELDREESPSIVPSIHGF
jgi:hypothetical protein